MTETIQIKQQLIRALLQNLDWETNPKCNQKLYQIQTEIFSYWKDFKDAKYNSQTKEFEQ